MQKNVFFLFMAMCLLVQSCSNANYETTVFEGLRLEHPKKSLSEYKKCKVPELGAYLLECTKNLSVLTNNLRVTSIGNVVFLYYPMGMKDLGLATSEKEFAEMVSDIKRNVYLFEIEFFILLCDEDFQANKLIGEQGLLYTEHGKTIEIEKVEVLTANITDCRDSHLFYNTPDGKSNDESGSRLSLTVPSIICFQAFNGSDKNIYVRNNNSLFDMVVADFKVQGNKHSSRLCISYYLHQGKTDFLSGISVDYLDKDAANYPGVAKEGQMEYYLLKNIERLFEDELCIGFTKKPEGNEMSFKLSSTQLNNLYPGLIKEFDGEIGINNEMLDKHFDLVYQSEKMEDEMTGEVRDVLVLKRIKTLD